MQSSKNKSRSLSVYEFFQILQVEFISAELRTKIYPDNLEINHKLYWNKVKDGKRLKIENIAGKNQLPTIFSDADMLSIFEKKVYGDEGFPNFSYRNEEDKIKQEPLDRTYYFHKDSEVRFEEYGEQVIGKIKSYVYPSETVTVVNITDATKQYTLNINKVTRIL